MVDLLTTVGKTHAEREVAGRLLTLEFPREPFAYRVRAYGKGKKGANTHYPR
jgi:hypothetical protein